MIFFNEKKIDKDSNNFWHRKLTLEVKFWHVLALFDTSPLTKFSKFNNFVWVCWFWGKNLYNFVAPDWKLDHPYYHNHRPHLLGISEQNICDQMSDDFCWHSVHPQGKNWGEYFYNLCRQWAVQELLGC